MNTLEIHILYNSCGVYRGISIFLILAHQGSSNEHRQSMFGGKIRKVLLVIDTIK